MYIFVFLLGNILQKILKGGNIHIILLYIKFFYYFYFVIKFFILLFLII